MSYFRRRLLSIGWIALFAMLGLALAPTVSHALARSGAAGGFNPWAEICSVARGDSANGSVAVAVVASHAPAQAHATQLDHCPLCGHAGAAPSLPVPDAVWFDPADVARITPPPSAPARPLLFTGLAARPRGPPAVS